MGTLFAKYSAHIVSVMAISIPHGLSGTYIAESVFNYAGIGALVWRVQSIMTITY